MSTSLPVAGVIGPMQRRLGAVVLAGEMPVIVFGALTLWGLARADGDPRATIVLTAGLGLALLAVLAAGLLRRPFGVTLGWIVQLGTLVGAVLEPAVVLVTLIFGGLWVSALLQGAKMDDLTARYERAAAQEREAT